MKNRMFVITLALILISLPAVSAFAQYCTGPDCRVQINDTTMERLPMQSDVLKGDQYCTGPDC